MFHFILLIYFFCLIIGIWATSDSHQSYRIYKYPFLHSLVRYIVFLNIVVFMVLIAKYLWINFPESKLRDTQSIPYTFFLLLLSIALIAWIYSFIRVIFEFKEKTITQKTNLFITAGILIVCFSYIIGLTIYFGQGSNHWIISTYRGLFLVSGLIFITGLFSLIIPRQTSQNNRKHKSIKAFGWISLVGYLLVYTNSFLPEPLSIFTTSTGLLVLNAGHIIWLKAYFLRHFISFPGEQDQQFLESIFEQYQISHREQEILQLLMQGKSNKEIESTLYISYNTVKNHIYNLYQKLGVNSRWQMLHLVMKAYDRKQYHPKK